MRMLIRLETHHREELVDITDRVRTAVRETGIRDGLVALYAQGATAALWGFRRGRGSSSASSMGRGPAGRSSAPWFRTRRRTDRSMNLGVGVSFAK